VCAIGNIEGKSGRSLTHGSTAVPTRSRGQVSGRGRAWQLLLTTFLYSNNRQVQNSVNDMAGKWADRCYSPHHRIPFESGNGKLKR